MILAAGEESVAVVRVSRTTVLSLTPGPSPRSGEGSLNSTQGDECSEQEAEHYERVYKY